MPIIADYHLHSSFSGDSDTPMEEMIQAAIKKELKQICFTEHVDFDYPYRDGQPNKMFELNADSYLYQLLTLRAKYESQIVISYGIELGLQPQSLKKNLIFARSHEYDFIIGSTHLCNGGDPYYSDFYEGRSEEEAYLEYFNCVLENVKAFHNFDICGHLDYVVRYGPNKDAEYSYQKYQDVIDPVLKYLVENEKGLELNTGALSRGMKDCNPNMDILKRYHALGGELITIGSDAHTSAHVGEYFDRAYEMLKECGFKYYCIYENRIAEFVKL